MSCFIKKSFESVFPTEQTGFLLQVYTKSGNKRLSPNGNFMKRARMTLVNENQLPVLKLVTILS